MSAWYLAPSLSRLRDEANRLYPQRSKASDGTIGDAAHSARTSDHNPKPDGRGGMVVDALDLTHDPAHGFDAHDWIRRRAAAMDPRIKYAISRGQLWSPSTGWARYTGSNPHDTHVHISVWANDAARRDQMPWFPEPPPPPVPPKPTPLPIPRPLEEDPMFLAWDPNAAWLVFRDAVTGTLFRTYVGELSEARSIEAACQGGKVLVAPKLLERIPVAS